MGAHAVTSAEVAIARDIASPVTLLSQRYVEYNEQAIRVATRDAFGALHPEGVVLLSADMGA